MRLKVRGDTFFLPSSDGSVYFRNNIGSFRMEGSTIDQWIEKLIPVFNGEHSMHEITDGLTDQYRDHVYEIAKVLYANGYVQDVSQDRPHQLPSHIVKQYEAQIEFLDSFDGSGAYRFELFRKSSVLVVGNGNFLVSVVKSLLESGLPQFHFINMNTETKGPSRITELVHHYRPFDSEVKVDEISLPKDGGVEWSLVIQQYDAIFYVSDTEGEAELQSLNQVCRQNNKVLLPAVILGQAGLAVPLTYSIPEGDWESARRRVHYASIYEETSDYAGSSVAESLLANVIVFEWLKTAAGVTKLENNKLFLLNLETLEGKWHPFLPHPLVNEKQMAKKVEDYELLSEESTGKRDPSGLLPFFSQLTSMETGIFHIWEEGELRQLPLSQCRVQSVDPLSEGPALLLSEIICNGIRHEEARREAGLAGIESYVSRMANIFISQTSENGSALEPVLMSVGAGVTIEEGVCRALQKFLSEEWIRLYEAEPPSITPIKLSHIEDERCRYYINALTTMQGSPSFGISETVIGFPVVWLRTNGCWYHAVDLNETRALRRVLLGALLDIQNKESLFKGKINQLASVNVKEDEVMNLSITECDPFEHREVLKNALMHLQNNQKRLLVYNLTSEAFFNEELAGVFGISLREETEE
ncbi:putative thiazole-containing bacteriocin maturation protein [Paenibacillus sp. FSL A5-0031]|nr:putative thiazole-containing bacteriocin maturation protein [Paenibacillus sp. FSL A5-0031]